MVILNNNKQQQQQQQQHCIFRVYNFVFCLIDVEVSVIDVSSFGLSGHVQNIIWYIIMLPHI
jgi:hypothetical protein